MDWDHLSCFRLLCVRYLYVDPVSMGGRAVILDQGEIPWEFDGDWLWRLRRQVFNLPVWPG
jgi:hypothetical protein